MDYKELANSLKVTEQELRNLEKECLKETVRLVQVYSMEAFKKKQWDGQAWEKRKRLFATKYDRRKKDEPRGLMIGPRGGGLLKGSINTFSSGGNVIISTDMPYSQIHNEGGVINHPGGTPYTFGKDGKSRFISRKRADELEVKAQMRRTKNSQITNTRRFRVTKPHKIEIPKRQYIGHSEELETQIENMVYTELEKLFLKDIK